MNVIEVKTENLMSRHVSAVARVSHQQTHTWSRLVWIVSLLPSTVSPTHHSFTYASLAFFLSFVGGSLLSPHTVCGGILNASQICSISAPHLSTPVILAPYCAEGTSGVGSPPCCLGFMISVCSHSYRMAQRLDLCQVKQQVSADISCNLCVTLCWRFLQCQQLSCCAWLNMSKDIHSHKVTQWNGWQHTRCKCIYQCKNAKITQTFSWSKFFIS